MRNEGQPVKRTRGLFEMAFGIASELRAWAANELYRDTSLFFFFFFFFFFFGFPRRLLRRM
ncbi:uncharacterized protein IWZ02DRAFT_278020 [Phyllosticta citriasiana]|uniref:uncharacterized protein n=1 Tax=Phyllosticta citriasiana TaxID=595635 RepID=UPI0030FD2D90